jgi:3-hydroxyacyl-CoA dehydrogenase
MTRRIEKAAVIGSGVMGGGIAALCAGAGVKTVLLDIVPFDLKDEEKDNPKARNRIVQAGLDAQLKAKPAAFFNKKADMNLLSIGNLDDDLDQLKDCDLIIEVVVENLKIKQSLFEKVEKVRKPGSIIASNTSGLPLASMAEGRSQDFKDNFIIMHFFNPPRYLKLLELVAGPETKQDVCDFIENWGEKVLGKGIVWAKDTPNFIGNRIGVGLIGEALKLLNEEDITVPEFDATFGPAFGMPKTAIFALCDLVGLDTIDHLSKNSYELLTEDERRESYKLPEFFTKLVEAGCFGKKTRDKGGFYRTEIDPNTWKKIHKVLDIKTGEHVEYNRKDVPDLVKEIKKLETLAEKQKAIFYSDDRVAKVAWKLGAQCLIYAANRVPEISDAIVGIDNAMKWGYALESGPFEVWDNIGVRKSVDRMKAEGFAVPDSINKMLDGGNETFYRIHNGKKQYFDLVASEYKDLVLNESCVFLADLRADNKLVKGNECVSLIDLGDGVFNVEFHTKMNALNKTILDFIGEAADYVLENGIGIVIGNQAPGMPGAFSAGGDLAFMGNLAAKGDFDGIDDFIKGVHKAVLGMKYAPIPIVAAPYGMTLGGGCEVCLAADRIVAHAELYMGLVEIGAGLVPGGCGMMHLWQRLMDRIPGKVKLVDYGAFMIPAFTAVAQAKYSGSAFEAREWGFLAPTDRIVMNKDHLIGEAKKEVLTMVEQGYNPPAKKKYPVMGREAQGMIWAELYNMGAGGYLPKHMGNIARKIVHCLSGGDAKQGMMVSEEYLCKLEREAFVELWRTEETQKMAEHILKTGKPLFM